MHKIETIHIWHKLYDLLPHCSKTSILSAYFLLINNFNEQLRGDLCEFLEYSTSGF